MSTAVIREVVTKRPPSLRRFSQSPRQAPERLSSSMTSATIREFSLGG
jgi:hypothetical protein